MLKPSYFDGKSELVEKYYRDLEDYLLNDIARFLLQAGELGGKADRELFVLQQMGLSNAAITSKLAQISGQSKSAVREVLQGSVMTSFSNDQEVLEKYFDGDFAPLDNPTIIPVMDAEWQKTCGELDNLTRTTMAQYNMDVVNLLNQAEIQVTTGMSSYSAAVCDVLDKYAAKGMIIDYPTGARRSLEAAVRCCVVTSMNQTAAQVTNKYIAEGGIEYVLVSAHEGARHSDKGGLFSHDGWQGKAYKIRGSEAGYPNLLESTGYDIDPSTGEGQVVNPAGLHGYNCRHSHSPWDKGLENPWLDENGKPRVDPQKSREKYEQQQIQRGMERSIRQTKRQLNMKQSELDLLPEGSIEHDTAQADYDRITYKLRQKNMKYGEYCADHNLAQQVDRVKTAGWTAADSRKANGRATVYKNNTLSAEKTGIVQEFKKIELSDVENEIETSKGIINYRKINTYNNVYVSDAVHLKPKSAHEINMKMTDAYKKMGIANADNLPQMIIVNDTELGMQTYAAYRATDNKLFVNSKIIEATSADNMDAIQTFCHELYHWKDAQKHIASGGIINKQYYEALNSKAKAKLEILKSKGYNLNKISDYASKSYRAQKYDEVYTEYRVKRLFNEI